MTSSMARGPMYEDFTRTMAFPSKQIPGKRKNGFNPMQLTTFFFWFASEQFMHNKFAVIDERIVITGSFNWSIG
jgi:phosphatidylserine/phosphatidylglycerophosphate/cardiolipin synthase-like enzyme